MVENVDLLKTIELQETLGQEEKQIDPYAHRQ